MGASAQSEEPAQSVAPGRSGPATRSPDSPEFARLGREEALELLVAVPVGRLIFTINALPAVRPMNFALVDDLIVLRTAIDSTVARKVDGVVVAFEVDELDVEARSGWSVVIHGRATVVTDDSTVRRLRDVPLVAWAPGQRDQFVTITVDVVEGTRVAQRG